MRKYECYLDEFQNNPQSSGWTTADSVAHPYISFTYDAVWTMAFALHKTQEELTVNGSNLTLTDFMYFMPGRIGEAINRHIKQTNFTGVSVSTYRYAIC